MTAVDPDAPTARLSEAARRFLAPPRFAIVSSLNPDGSPLQAVIWYKLDGDSVVFNSRLRRRWPTNLERERRVSVIVEDGYDYLEMRGEVEIDEDPIEAQAVAAELAHRYHDDEAVAAATIEEFSRQQRVTFRLRPTRVFERFADH